MPSPRHFGLREAVLCVVLYPFSAGADPVTISSGPPVNATGIGNSFGRVGVLGQVFTAPAGATALTGFEFWWMSGGSEYPPFPTLDFRAYVFRWQETDANNGASFGEPLYVSPEVPVGQFDSFPSHQFSPPAVAVTPGSMYVAFVAPTEAALAGDQEGFWTMGTSFCGFEFCGPLGSNWPGGHVAIGWWDRSRAVDWAAGDLFGTSLQDAAFRATFDTESAAPVPEPASVVLLGTGLFFSIRRRVRKRFAEQFPGGGEPRA